MFPDRLSFAMITLISSKESNSMTIERLTSRFILILVILLLIIIKNKQMIRCQQQSTDVGHGDNDVDDQQSNQFDQILKELNILTQQQLDVPRSTTTTTTKQTTTTTTTVTDDSSSSKTLSKQSMDNNDHRTEKINEIKPNNQQLRMGSRNFDQFRLPDGYDVNKPPKFSKSNPIKIMVNLTVLDTTIDKHENVIILDLKIDECWKDKRFRIKKNGAKNSNNGNHSLDDDDYEIDESDLKRQENHLLESEWLNKIWHPISRLRNNAHVTNALFDKPKQTLQKTIEQEKLIEKIHIQSNSTTAWVWISLKMRVNIPIYECRRDDSRIYPFDRIRCSFHIANALHDKRTISYEWDRIKWDHNEYHSGRFYLRQLSTSIENAPIIDLDESGSEHSIMRIDFMLKRQIGDYVLNIYVFHIFLLILCVSTFWISIKNVFVRMSLAIIILIIIKFQTFQTFKEEHRIVSALSIWTFGLSFLVILCILCHILSFYAHQHDWNEKILQKIVENRSSSATMMTSTTSATESPKRSSVLDGDGSDRMVLSLDHHSTKLSSPSSLSSSPSSRKFYEIDGNLTNGKDSHNSFENSSNFRANQTAAQNDIDKIINGRFKKLKHRLDRLKHSILLRFNSIIVNNLSKNQSYDQTNLIDILARIFLTLIYILFVVIYFFKYAF